MFSKKSRIFAQYLYILSIIFLTAGFLLAYFTYNLVSPYLTGYRLYGFGDYFWLMAPFAVIFYFLLFFFGMYSDLQDKKLKDDILNLFEITAISVFLIFAFLFMFKITYVSRLFIGYFSVYAFISLIAADYFGRKFAGGLRGRKYSLRNIVLVCEKDEKGLKEAIKSQGYLGADIVGEFKLGDLEKISDFVLDNPVDEVIFDISGENLTAIKDVILLLEEKGITVKILTGFIPFRNSKVSFESLKSFTFLSFHTAPEDDLRLLIKRLTDITGSIVALAVFLVPSLIIGLLIRLSSSGPVLYKSKRVGLNGRLFTFYKFRTMYSGSDELRKDLIKKYSKDGIEIKLKDDPRITPVGRFLRKTSLDELPQFYNVLRGDMSLVGPRPPMPDEVSKYSVKQRRRISMKPGITCLWQISGRSRLSFEERVKLDLEYIDNWSLKLDLFILLKTIPAVLFASGAL